MAYGVYYRYGKDPFKRVMELVKNNKGLLVGKPKRFFTRVEAEKEAIKYAKHGNDVKIKEVK